MEEKDSAASQAPFTLVVTDVGPSTVMRLPHCTKAPPNHPPNPEAGVEVELQRLLAQACALHSAQCWAHQEDRGPFVFTQRCSKH